MLQAEVLVRRASAPCKVSKNISSTPPSSAFKPRHLIDTALLNIKNYRTDASGPHICLCVEAVAHYRGLPSGLISASEGRMYAFCIRLSDFYVFRQFLGPSSVIAAKHLRFRGVVLSGMNVSPSCSGSYAWFMWYTEGSGRRFCTLLHNNNNHPYLLTPWRHRRQRLFINLVRICCGALNATIPRENTQKGPQVKKKKNTATSRTSMSNFQRPFVAKWENWHVTGRVQPKGTPKVGQHPPEYTFPTLWVNHTRWQCGERLNLSSPQLQKHFPGNIWPCLPKTSALGVEC